MGDVFVVDVVGRGRKRRCLPRRAAVGARGLPLGSVRATARLGVARGAPRRCARHLGSVRDAAIFFETRGGRTVTGPVAMRGAPAWKGANHMSGQTSIPVSARTDFNGAPG